MYTTSSYSKHIPKTKLQPDAHPLDMSRVATIILGGGQSPELAPLTLTRCKPAISFGGKGRLVDIPMSNTINSGCQKIFIVSQTLSSSLHQHIIRTYRPGSYSTGFIELLSTEQKKQSDDWIPGPADTLRENIEYLIESSVDYFLILSGDHLYQMDFRNMLRLAQTTQADLIISTLPVEEKKAKKMGLLKIDKHANVSLFHENPTDRQLLQSLQIPDTIKEKIGGFTKAKQYLGSMGIYLFKKEALFRLLQEDRREDFGPHLIPTQVEKGKTTAYIHHGYWENIGNIQSFHRANLALTQAEPKFNWYDEHNPIYTTHSYLPPPKVFACKLNHAIICEGSIVRAKEISHSILGYRSIVGEKSIIRNSYIMGNDFYTPPIPTKRLPDSLHIGNQSHIENAIIDKHVSIGNKVRLINKKGIKEYESETLSIRQGIIIVKRGARIPDEFNLSNI